MARCTVSVLLALSCEAHLHVHNPQNVTVTTVHMVLSSHFDGGCKTPNCGALKNGEPDLCASVGPHWKVNPKGQGEPFNYHIVNRYFDEFVPRAIRFAAQQRGTTELS